MKFSDHVYQDVVFFGLKFIDSKKSRSVILPIHQVSFLKRRWFRCCILEEDLIICRVAFKKYIYIDYFIKKIIGHVCILKQQSFFSSKVNLSIINNFRLHSFASFFKILWNIQCLSFYCPFDKEWQSSENNYTSITSFTFE